MARKVFLKRDFFKKQSNVNYRYFLWAAVGLLVLVVLTPLLTRRRADMPKPAKLNPEAGMVLKEIPKETPMETQSDRSLLGGGAVSQIKEGDLEPGSDANRGGYADELSNETSVGGHGLAGSAGSIQEGSEPTQNLASSVTQNESQPQPHSAEQEANSTPVPQPAEPTSSSETAAAVTGEQPSQSPADVPGMQASVSSQPQPAAKPVEKTEADSSMTRYIVQIGSFSQKKNADSMHQSLTKKGYEVIIRTVDHAKFGKLYVVQLQALTDPLKAESLLAKVKKDANVKPMMVKVPAGQ